MCWRRWNAVGLVTRHWRGDAARSMTSTWAVGCRVSGVVAPAEVDDLVPGVHDRRATIPAQINPTSCTTASCGGHDPDADDLGVVRDRNGNDEVTSTSPGQGSRRRLRGILPADYLSLSRVFPGPSYARPTMIRAAPATAGGACRGGRSQRESREPARRPDPADTAVDATRSPRQ